jgi:serine/threonine-protein kinase
MIESAPFQEEWPLEVRKRVHAVCLRFEDIWQSGTPPQLETFLGELDASDRQLLFQELLGLDLYYRRRRGETPQPEDYTSRFPEHTTQVAAAFHVEASTASLPPGVGPKDTLQRVAAETLPGPPTATDEPLPEVPGFEIRERLGHGGMGVVYRARQAQPQREVALKMLLGGAHAGAGAVARFRIEMEAIARLRHPNVVQVYEVGEHRGLPYFTMEYVPGGSLAARLPKDDPLPPRLAAQLVVPLALAVHAIHNAGVVHRDLKPGNILLDGQPDAPLEQCTPRVSDFGLAKLLDSGQTQTIGEMGTPPYMAPEQVAPGIAAAGCWTDVHGLGAILYRLLTGRPPFQGDGKEQIFWQVRHHEPTFPRRPRSRLERDLQTVCRKCLEKAPSRRYGTAADVADRLQRILNDQPIPERPPGWVERAGRVLRRHWLVVGLVQPVLGAAGGIWGYTALTAYLSDPQRVREGTEDRLRRGEKVTLVGENGPPGYFQWGEGETTSLISNRANRPFSVFAAETALIEFPYAKGLKHYRLRAEVRHDKSPGITLVGLYVGRHQYGARKGVERSSFVCLSFCDRGTLTGFDKNERKSKAALEYYYLEPRDVPVHPRVEIKKPLPYAIDFPINGPSPWRELVLEVSPDRISAFWGEEPGRLKEVTTITIPQLLNEARSKMPYLDPVVKELTTREGVALDFSPGGGLGLFVRHGIASFRNVVLEPIPDRP